MPRKKSYPKDNGPVTQAQAKITQQSAAKAKKPTKVKTDLFQVRPEEPGVHVGNYSVRTVDQDGMVSFEIDWDRLREHMKTV